MLRTFFRSSTPLTLRRISASPVAARSASTFIGRQSFTPMRFYSAGAAKLDKDEVTRRVIDVIKAFGKSNAAATITPTTLFNKDLGLDSLDTVELLVAVEEEFDIEIPDKIADELKSVAETVDYITSNADAN
ncbi:hypothetical protein NCAS_0J01790 [Naumovozyma castellii]|uniref:Acyl carrier protein n=1 Tax=Naumovozyma castellii TaxID=27288 RepID=G0VKX0_NAUCA|nr:hypothetical protein NCAS_0J01790 [Naumovozyma castellii CBS 4309]CCC72158.1 hypothetical protein NCAS_0J01790 [Naumovozyma castellii CBS 4309]